MRNDFLKVNINQFSEEEPPATEPATTETPDEDFSEFINGDTLDVEGLISKYGNTAEEEPTPEEPENPDVTTEPETPEKVEGDPTSETTEPEPEPKQTPDEAFAEMRRRAESNEKLAAWVQDIATKQGFQDPNQLIEAFNKQQLEKEAQQKGVPVDVYERLKQLEEDNHQKDEEMFRERFNTEVAETKDKYKLSDDQVTEVFRFMGQRGYITPEGRSTIPFEDAYTLANRDTLIQQAEERAKQDYLEEKQKKQKQATPNVPTHATDKAGTDDILDKDPLQVLEEMNIEWR